MKKACVSIFAIATMLVCYAYNTKETASVTYCNERFGYTSADLILFADSTYKFHRWNHTGSITDYGTWGRQKDNLYYLNSSKKSRWTRRGGKSKKAYLFIKDNFIVSGDTLRMISENEGTKNTFFDLEYKLYKCPDEASYKP